MYPVLFPIKRGDFALMTPSALTIAERFWKHVRKTDGCWEWEGNIHSKGYGRMEFNLKRVEVGKEKIIRVRAHRLSWQLNVGEIPNGIGVLHKCDNRKCVRPEHLFLGTDKDNYEDAIAKGRRINSKQGFARGPAVPAVFKNDRYAVN
jgi:hypothetical protein